MERELTPEERKKVEDAYQKADPTAFSEVSPKGELQAVGETEPRYMNRTYSIKSDGASHFVEIPISRMPARQQAVARILKGILNVSDMVERDGTYYSKIVPLERIGKEETMAEIRAGIMLLEILFGDWDHDYRMDGETSQNMRDESGRVAYFDFNEARPELGSRRISPMLEAAELGREELAALSHKLGEVLERYDSEEGRVFLGTVLESVSTDTGALFDPTPTNHAEQAMDPKERFIHAFIMRARGNKALVDARLTHLDGEVTGDS